MDKTEFLKVERDRLFKIMTDNKFGKDLGQIRAKALGGIFD